MAPDRPPGSFRIRSPSSAYEQALSGVEGRDMDAVRDIKAVKLYSLAYHLAWYNNELKKYEGEAVNHDPLARLVEKKGLYYQVCMLMLEDVRLELGGRIEEALRRFVDSAHASMRAGAPGQHDSRPGDGTRAISEGSRSVSSVNAKFRHLSHEANDSLKRKIPDGPFSMFCSLEYALTEG